MTARSHSQHVSDASEQAESDERQPRSLLTIAYTAATLLGGIGALVVLVVTLTSAGDASALDVLLWGALAALLFAAAAREWWFAGRAAARSRRIADQISAAEVRAVAAESDSDIHTIRRLRVAHPGLGLRDAYELAQRHASEGN